MLPNIERHPTRAATHIGYDATGWAFLITKTAGRYLAVPSHSQAADDGRRFTGRTLKELSATLAAAERGSMVVHVHGKPVTLSVATLQATRQWFADNARKCIAEALAYVATGGAEGNRVNDLESYVAFREETAAASLRGDGDRSLAFIQRAVALQTGECVPLMAPAPDAFARPMAAPGLTSYRYPLGGGRYCMIGATDDAGALREAQRTRAGAEAEHLEVWDANAARYVAAR